MRRSTSPVAAFAIACGLLLAAQAAPGATITWVGNASTQWGNGANWDLNRLPAAGDDVVIPAGRPLCFLNAAVNAVVGSVTAPGDFQIGGTLQINGPTSLGALNMTGGTVSAFGTVSFSGGRILSGTIAAMSDVSISGTAEIYAGAVISTPATLTFSGGRWMGGRLTGTGPTVVPPGATWIWGYSSSFSSANLLLERRLTNLGAIELQYGVTMTIGDGASLTNTVGGVILTSLAGSGFSTFSATGTGSVLNQGLIDLSGAVANPVPVSIAAFSNGATGRVRAVTSDFAAVGPGTEDGSFFADQGRVVSFRATPTNPISFAPTAQVTGPGQAGFRSCNVPLTLLRNTGGVLFDGSGETYASTLTGPTNGLDVIVKRGHLVAAGVHSWRSLTVDSVDGQSTIEATGTVVVTESASITAGFTSSTALLSAPGSLVFGPLCTTALSFGPVIFDGSVENRGTMLLNQAAMSITSGVFINRPEGTLSTRRDISGLGTGRVDNEGLISVSFNGSSPTFRGVRNLPTGAIRATGAGVLRIDPSSFILQGRIAAEDSIFVVGTRGVANTLGAGLAISAGGTISFSLGRTVIEPGVEISATGIEMLGSSFSSESLDIRTPIPNLASLSAQFSGRLTFSSDLSVRSLRVTSQGVIDGSGGLLVTDNCSIEGSILGGGPITFGPACVTTVATTNSGIPNVLARRAVNQGVMNLAVDAGLQIQGVVLENGPTGVINGSANFLRSSSLNTTQGGILRNLGRFQLQGLAVDNVVYAPSLDQRGVVRATNVTVSLFDVNQVVGEVLNGGTWECANAGRIRMFTGQTVKDVGPDATINLIGSGDFSLIAAGIRSLAGTLRLSQGRDYFFLPPGGTFTNSGLIDLGPGSDMHVAGRYVQTAAGQLAVAFDAPPPQNRRLSCAGIAQLDGTLSPRLASGYVLTPGQSLSTVVASERQGAFAAIDPMGGLAVAYSATGAAVTTRCAADFNGDGANDPDDLADFITCYFSSPACPRADFNADSRIDPDDLSDFFSVFFRGCP